MKKVYLYMVMVLLSITAFYAWEYFLQFSLSKLHLESTKLVTISIRSIFIARIIFSISFGLIPLLYLVSIKIATPKSTVLRTLILFLILAFGFLFWFNRILILNDQVGIYLGSEPIITFYFKNLMLSRFLLLGFISGAIISIVTIKIINRKLNSPPKNR